MDVFSIHSAEQLIAEDGLCPDGLPWDCQWKMVIAKIQPINTVNLWRVAMDMLTPDGRRRNDEEAFELSREELLELLDGLEGIERLKANAQILIHLGFLLQHHFESVENIAEEMFLSLRSLWWHVDRLRTAQRNQCLEYHIDNYGRNVVIDYYRMARKLFLFVQENSPPIDVRDGPLEFAVLWSRVSLA